jgi:hypothetical protein
MLQVPADPDREWFGTGSLGIRDGVKRSWNRVGRSGRAGRRGRAAGNTPAPRPPGQQPGPTNLRPPRDPPGSNPAPRTSARVLF